MFTASAAAAAPVGPSGVPSPPSPPSVPGGVSSEESAAAAAAEESKQANAAADAVSQVLDQVSIGLANSLPVGGSVTIASPGFTMVVEKARIPRVEVSSGEPPDEAANNEAAAAALSDLFVTPPSPEEQGSGSGSAEPVPDPPPKAVFSPANEAMKKNLAKLANSEGAPPVFVIPPGLKALEGQDSVDVQLLSYTASSRSPPPPPPGETKKQETASSITSMTLRIDGSDVSQEGDDGGEQILFTRKLGKDARRRLQETIYDCRDEQTPIDQCNQNLTLAVAALTEQQAVCSQEKEDAGNDIQKTSFPECELLADMAAAARALNEKCMALPMPCNGRGACDGETGACSCYGNNLGPSCGEAPACRYWDVAASGWASAGLTLEELDPTTGGAVCATSHLTDFAVVSDVLTSPDAFFESFADLNVNLPKAMTLEELLAVLADIEPAEYSAMGLATMFACGLMWLAVLYDDRRAYVEFFPRWHSFLGQEGLGSKILKASITWQAWAAQLTVLLASNHYFAVFFVLPTMPTRRTQRLMTVYLVVLSQFAVLILFFGQEQTGLTALWGILLANGIVVVIKVVSVKLFNSAVIPKVLLCQDREKVARQRIRRRRHGSWDLVLRQSVPGSKKKGAKARSLWTGDSLYTLIEPTEPQFYDARCVQGVLPLYKAKYGQHRGEMTCKLKLTQPSGVWMAIEWRQASALGAAAVEKLEVLRVYTSEEEQLTSTSNANKSLERSYHENCSRVNSAFKGLRKGDARSLLQGGDAQGEGQRFTVGVCEKPAEGGACGGLTGLGLESAGWTVLAKVEVYLSNHRDELSPAQTAAQEHKAKDKAWGKRLSATKQLAMEMMGMVPVQHMDDEQDDDSDDEERQADEAAAKKLVDDRRSCLEASRSLKDARGAAPFEEVKVCYAKEGRVRALARENSKKRVALQRSVTATAKVVSEKGQCIYRSVAKIALNVRPPAFTPSSMCACRLHVHVHVHVHVYVHVHAHVHVLYISTPPATVHNPLLPAAFQVQEVPEDLLHPKRSKVYTVKTLDLVPANCIFLQADGSVGFFIQPRDEWQEVLELKAVEASLRKVCAPVVIPLIASCLAHSLVITPPCAAEGARGCV